MKKNNKQTASHNMPNICVSFWTCTILINQTSIRYDEDWNSCNYREGAFSKMTSRDRRIEYHLMAVNALLVDYHYHTRVSWVESRMYIEDYCPVEDYSYEETREILMEAKRHNEYILQSILKEDWETRKEYLALSITMMVYIYKIIYPCYWCSEAVNELEEIIAQALQPS